MLLLNEMNVCVTDITVERNQTTSLIIKNPFRCCLECLLNITESECVVLDFHNYTESLSSSSQGLKFPWESAVSGREVCPEDIYGKQEIHINGDVALAFQHYLYLTEVFTPFCPIMCACVCVRVC